MPTVLANGYLLPVTGERGSVFYPALADNIQRMNDHTHSGHGLDGEPINCKHLTKTAASILAAGWVAVSGQTGTYRQLVTIPEGFAWETAELKFLIDGGSEDGAVVYPSVEKASATTFYVYINDNTLSLKVIYG